MEAAKLLIWPDSVELEGLESTADVLIVVDTANAIMEGDAYLGVPGGKDRAWTELVTRVRRHTP